MNLYSALRENTSNALTSALVVGLWHIFLRDRTVFDRTFIQEEKQDFRAVFIS